MRGRVPQPKPQSSSRLIGSRPHALLLLLPAEPGCHEAGSLSHNTTPVPLTPAPGLVSCSGCPATRVWGGGESPAKGGSARGGPTGQKCDVWRFELPLLLLSMLPPCEWGRMGPAALAWGDTAGLEGSVKV